MSPKLKTKSNPEDPPVNPPGDRALRIITVVTFWPAFALLIPHGVVSEDVCPALGLVPMFLSGAFGLVHSCKTIRSRSIDEIIDAFLAVFLTSIMIPSVVSIATEWCGNAILGAYGTMPMIINLFIHVYFALRNIASKVFTNAFKDMFEPPRCPHCNGKQIRNWRKATREGSIHSCESTGRYRDDPEAEGEDDDESVVSASTAKQKQKQKAAPLFKTPPPEEEEDPAVLV